MKKKTYRVLVMTPSILEVQASSADSAKRIALQQRASVRSTGFGLVGGECRPQVLGILLPDEVMPPAPVAA